MRTPLVLAGLLGLSITADGALAVQATLFPSQDAPIYGNEFSANASGTGESLFAGMNGTGSPRRSLLQFDLQALPDNAVITGASLSLFLDREPNASFRTLVLHEVTEAWTTGASDASLSPGQGVPAQPGDSTWFYRSFPGNGDPGWLWTTPGGTYAASVVASLSVGPLSVGADPSSVYVWSGPGMAASLQGWLDAPETNHGWILIGDETVTQTVKRFVSREGFVDDWLRPNLVVTYDVLPSVPEPSTWVLLAGGLAIVGVTARRRGAVPAVG